ncbi:metallophosphoesterase [Muricauda sp. SCSIO 64092]|uniref:metallophosphoesterase family protein n=1 Tax=Allomuricauda sp. SCSIO 64092 TaxID=2908842 RepID=UPI001FF2B47A|nr:metallophosphoesterase [Muricauda sp. SCSIO 64092]UOY05513.1 metallophosphoesterase [Muricauda sp. SCSIO 64092]
MIERIAHITDLHLDEEFPFNDQVSARKRLDAILRDIKGENIDYIICTGDIGENEGIPYFFEQVKSNTLSITLGNHDKFDAISKYHDVGADHTSKKIYRSTLKAYYKFIFLDSSSGTIDGQQLDWLKKELISTKPIVIFMHHPIIGLNVKVDEIGKLKNRNELTDILTGTTNVIHIYCGHYHMEDTLVHKNIIQYITPAVAFQIKKSSDSITLDTSISGYRIIQIEKSEISSKVKLLSNAD